MYVLFQVRRKFRWWAFQTFICPSYRVGCGTDGRCSSSLGPCRPSRPEATTLACALQRGPLLTSSSVPSFRDVPMESLDPNLFAICGVFRSFSPGPRPITSVSYPFFPPLLLGPFGAIIPSSPLPHEVGCRAMGCDCSDPW